VRLISSEPRSGSRWTGSGKRPVRLLQPARRPGERVRRVRPRPRPVRAADLAIRGHDVRRPGNGWHGRSMSGGGWHAMSRADSWPGPWWCWIARSRLPTAWSTGDGDRRGGGARHTCPDHRARPPAAVAWTPRMPGSTLGGSDGARTRRLACSDHLALLSPQW